MLFASAHSCCSACNKWVLVCPGCKEDVQQVAWPAHSSMCRERVATLPLQQQDWQDEWHDVNAQRWNDLDRNGDSDSSLYSE